MMPITSLYFDQTIFIVFGSKAGTFSMPDFWDTYFVSAIYTKHLINFIIRGINFTWPRNTEANATDNLGGPVTLNRIISYDRNKF